MAARKNPDKPFDNYTTVTYIHVNHCTFEHVHKGVRFKAVGRQDAIDEGDYHLKNR